MFRKKVFRITKFTLIMISGVWSRNISNFFIKVNSLKLLDLSFMILAIHYSLFVY